MSWQGYLRSRAKLESVARSNRVRVHSGSHIGNQAVSGMQDERSRDLLISVHYR